MDSNVSKNTNSHNFFKLGIKRSKLGISLENLLKQELLLILDLYRQKFNAPIERKFIAGIIANKLGISERKNGSIELKNSISYCATDKFVPLVYSCPIGLLLANSLQQTPQIIMQQLGLLLNSNLVDKDREISLSIAVQIVPRGWINFYLDSRLVTLWLQEMFDWHEAKSLNSPLVERRIFDSEKTEPNLFPAQYIHARCCSCLNLAAREKLIDLSAGSTAKINWLDESQTLWLTEVAERNVLQQLAIASDLWQEDIGDRQWSKIALNLSEATAVFFAQCRFLGEVRQKYPSQAIARLGLIALVRFWLEQILELKLQIAAPLEL